MLLASIRGITLPQVSSHIFYHYRYLSNFNHALKLYFLYCDAINYMAHRLLPCLTWWLLMAWHMFAAYMMTSSNGIFVRVTGHLCGEIIGHRRIPCNGNIFRVTVHLCGEFNRSPVNSPHKGQWRGALMFSLISAWINGLVNNGEAGDLRRHRAHYDVTVMWYWY